jgi:hypothetical protein
MSTMEETKENGEESNTNTNNNNNDDDDDDDDDSIDLIRAPNESPDRRSSASKVDNDMVKRCVYDDELDTEEYYRSVVRNHDKHNNSYSSLFAMALGFTEYDKMVEGFPFSETKKKKFTKHFRPSNQLMMFEVQRRAHFLSKLESDKEDNPFLKNGKLILPKPSQWSREKLIKWLKENILPWKQSDMVYMKHNVGVYKFLLSNSLKRKKNQFQLDESIWARSGWDGIVPNIRLIQIITSDDLKQSFINRNDMSSRQELDARGTESARVSFFEQVRKKFNNPIYLVTSARLEATWGG